jgi:tetratricopeptide (TPR) repeat protein
MNHPAASDDRTTTATLSETPAPIRSRVGVLLVGPKEARRKVRAQFGSLPMAESNHWHDLPAGPAVCIDARRFVYLSPDGVAALAGALLGGATVVVPASNTGVWPMCGLNCPRGSASVRELDQHAETIRGSVSDEVLDGSFPLPAVFGVADAASLMSRPTYIADLGDSARLLGSVWCHQREVPLVSATMIVKNEAQRIQKAIAAAWLLSDEVVVYDTGSTDDTVELARAMGASVRLGYWDDDFARARNEARAMMRGDWFLGIDADDTIDATPEQIADLRMHLRGSDGSRAVSLYAVNVTNDVTKLVHSGIWVRRILPRHLRFRNRIHEVAAEEDGTLPQEDRIEGVRLVHWGYGKGMAARTERNLRIASQRFEEGLGDEADRAHDHFEYGRALMMAGRFDEATEAYREVAASPHATEPLANVAAMYVAIMANNNGDDEEVARMLYGVIESSPDPTARDAARWQMALYSQRLDEAVAMLDSLETDGEVHYFYITASADEVAALRAFLAAQQFDEARVLSEIDRMEAPALQERAWWAVSLLLPHGHDRPALAMLAHTSEADLTSVSCALAGGPPGGGHDIMAALADHFGLDPAIEAFFVSASARGGFFAALDARLRLAEAGRLDAGDPLQPLADGEFGDCGDRMLASLALDALAPLETTRSTEAGRFVGDAQIGPVLAVVARVLPQQLTEAASALAYSTERGLLVAEALEQIEALAG